MQAPVSMATMPLVDFGSSFLIPLALIILCGLMPAAVLVGRHNVKKFRQRLLLGLEQTYERAGGSAEKLHLVPSFEIARYKYDLTSTEPEFSEAANRGHKTESGEGDGPARRVSRRRGTLWRDLGIYLLPG